MALMAAAKSDAPPGGLLTLGVLLIGLGVVHFRTALWWYDKVQPGWRGSLWGRSSAIINRWGGAGFLLIVGAALLVVQTSRLLQ
jgi:hypothetical protein